MIRYRLPTTVPGVSSKGGSVEMATSPTGTDQPPPVARVSLLSGSGVVHRWHFVADSEFS